jgi:hypothetical protein
LLCSLVSIRCCCFGVWLCLLVFDGDVLLDSCSLFLDIVLCVCLFLKFVLVVCSLVLLFELVCFFVLCLARWFQFVVVASVCGYVFLFLTAIRCLFVLLFVCIVC